MKFTLEQLRNAGYEEAPTGDWVKVSGMGADVVYKNMIVDPSPKRIRQSAKPLMNQTEQRCFDKLWRSGVRDIMVQAITLKLDPPFKSYRPDLAYIGRWGLVLVEAKGLHRFRRAGIAKAALAAKTYPCFRFELHEWNGKEWKETVLCDPPSW